MKEYILSILKANIINMPFYFDKFYLLSIGKFDHISIAFLSLRNIMYTASVTKSGISYELNLSKGSVSLLTFNYFTFEECMEMYELIVGKDAALIIDANLKTHYWRDKATHKVQDNESFVGSPTQINNFEYEPR